MRKIIHVDMDAYYASVEQRDRPELRGRPIAVGGSAESRGVIATCSYEARVFGVRSAMATARALRLCPELAVLPPRFAVYQAESQKIREVFRRYTDHVEPLSLDEATLDVTDSAHEGGSATRIAQAIQQQIREETGLSSSAGVAPNKFLAKIASDWRKPGGLMVIRPHEVADFVRELKVGRIPGVGSKTEERLHAMQLRTCGDLQALDMPPLQAHFGSWAERLYGLCRGEDDRPVVSEWQPRQVSVERTFARDFRDLDEAMPELEAMVMELQQRIRKREVSDTIRGLSVKLRLHDFKTRSGDRAGRMLPELTAFLAELERLHAQEPKPIRLIGIGVRLEVPGEGPRRRGDPRQLGLFERP